MARTLFLSGPVEPEIDEDLGSRHYDNSAAGPAGGTTGTDDDECPSDDSGSFNLARDTTPTTYRRVQEGRYDSDDVQSDPRGTQRNYRCIVIE